MNCTICQLNKRVSSYGTKSCSLPPSMAQSCISHQFQYCVPIIPDGRKDEHESRAAESGC